MLTIILGIIVVVLLLALWGAYRVVEKMSKEIELLKKAKTIINPIIREDKREVVTIRCATLVDKYNLTSPTLCDIVVEQALQQNLNGLKDEIKPYVNVRVQDEIGNEVLVETLLEVVKPK